MYVTFAEDLGMTCRSFIKIILILGKNIVPAPMRCVFCTIHGQIFGSHNFEEPSLSYMHCGASPTQ